MLFSTEVWIVIAQLTGAVLVADGYVWVFRSSKHPGLRLIILASTGLTLAVIAVVMMAGGIFEMFQGNWNQGLTLSGCVLLFFLELFLCYLNLDRWMWRQLRSLNSSLQKLGTRCFGRFGQRTL